MQTIESIHEMQSSAIAMRSSGHLIALVPTMGCLHEGHGKLIDIAREKADKVIVSIFVNPAQFGPNEDFEKYPRVLSDDLEFCRERGVDFVFNPKVEALYPEDFSTFVEEEKLSAGLCGISRPNYFRGVATICLKLFNITRPDIGIFGQKDAQQLALIRKMVNDLNLPLEIIAGPTHRDSDGLATSSRNHYLSDSQREDALRISRALETARELVTAGVRQVDRVIAEVTHELSQSRRVRVIYVQVVDRDSMESPREIIPGRHLLTVAVWVEDTRLIDNIEL